MGPVVPNAWSEIIIKTQRNSAVKEHVWLHSTQVVSKSNWPGNPFIFFLITCSTISWKPLTEMLAWVQPFLWNLIIFLGMSRNSHYAMRRLLESTEKWRLFLEYLCYSLGFDSWFAITIYDKAQHVWKKTPWLLRWGIWEQERKELPVNWPSRRHVGLPHLGARGSGHGPGGQGTRSRGRSHIALPGQTCLV